MRTCPGMTLREPGWACSSPTVPRPCGWLALAMPITACTVAGRQQRVATDRHGRGAGVHFHAGHDDVVPAQAQRSGDHAHDLFLVLQDRALLDVRLEIGVHRTAAHRVRAGVADGLQFVAHRQALGVAGGQRGFQREFAGEHARSHHHRHEARAFLVGPDGDFQRRFGLHAGVVERAYHFQARQHAVAAVELAASGLGVDVAARHDGGSVSSRPARRAKMLPSWSTRTRMPASRIQPVTVAALAVQRGQGQAAVAALGGGADPGQVHQGLPQPVAVDGQRELLMVGL